MIVELEDFGIMDFDFDFMTERFEDFSPVVLKSFSLPVLDFMLKRSILNLQL